MYIFIRPMQFLNLGPANQQLDALTIRTLGAQIYVMMIIIQLPVKKKLFEYFTE